MSAKSPTARARTVSRLLNLAILAASLTAAGMLVRKGLQGRPEMPVLVPSARIFVKGVDWARAEQTLLIAVSKDCVYCSKSGRFYRRLHEGLKGRADVKAVIVYPYETQQGEAYLGTLGLNLVN
jgi:hypothetical protein